MNYEEEKSPGQGDKEGDRSNAKGDERAHLGTL